MGLFMMIKFILLIFFAVIIYIVGYIKGFNDSMELDNKVIRDLMDRFKK